LIEEEKVVNRVCRVEVSEENYVSTLPIADEELGGRGEKTHKVTHHSHDKGSSGGEGELGDLDRL
jgi:hypothetical protein